MHASAAGPAELPLDDEPGTFVVLRLYHPEPGVAEPARRDRVAAHPARELPVSWRARIALVLGAALASHAAALVSVPRAIFTSVVGQALRGPRHQPARPPRAAEAGHGRLGPEPGPPVLEVRLRRLGGPGARHHAGARRLLVDVRLRREHRPRRGGERPRAARAPTRRGVRARRPGDAGRRARDPRAEGARRRVLPHAGLGPRAGGVARRAPARGRAAGRSPSASRGAGRASRRDSAVAQAGARARAPDRAADAVPASKPGTLTRGRRLPIACSMRRRSLSSCGETKVKASPVASARPVRPTRCT